MNLYNTQFLFSKRPRIKRVALYPQRKAGYKTGSNHTHFELRGKTAVNNKKASFAKAKLAINIGN